MILKVIKMLSSYLYINITETTRDKLAEEIGPHPWSIYEEDDMLVICSAELMAKEKGYNKAASVLCREDIYGPVIIIGLGGRNGKEWVDVSPALVERLKEICKKIRWEEYYHGNRKRAPSR